MKKFALFCASTLIAATAVAQSVTPQIFYENFVKMSETSDLPVDGWTAFGVDATPGYANPDYADIDEWMKKTFNNGKDIYVLLNYGAKALALSCTNFIPSTQADQWLVTPEIEIPYDEMSLYFTTAFYTNKGFFGKDKAPISVYVSESGVSKEDFGETPVYTYTLSPSQEQEITLKNFIVPLKGYKGKKIHLGFVQQGKDCGPVGFTNIGLGQYYCVFDATNTPAVCQKGEQVSIDNNIALKTPVTCKSLKVELEINGEKVAEETYSKVLGPSGLSPMYVRATFNDVMEMTETSLSYRLLVTPDFEGAVTSVYEGTIGYPVTNYLNNCVVEEITATGCQACPAGTASMQYYAETYPAGHPSRGRFIGIAIHGFINYTDPMSQGVQGYLSQALDKAASTTYPGANFNRGYVAQYPWQTSSMQREIMSRSYNKAEVTEVMVPQVDGDQTDLMYGKNVKVKYNVYSAYDSSSKILNAAVVMVENDVRGYESGYTQTNGFYNRTDSYITSNYGSFLIPYIKPYLAGGTLGQQYVSFDKMVYQHVARGIFPSYNGEEISTEWVANQPCEFELTFQLPDNVDNWENTEVIILITDPSQNGKIVASDIFPASKFIKGETGAVSGVSVDSSSIRKVGDNIEVNVTENTKVDVFAVDGTLLGSYNADANGVTINGSAFSGIVIVKAGNVTKKLMF